MKRYLATLIGILALVMTPFALTAQSYTAQAGVSLFTGVSATATSTSGTVRLPTFSGTGTLNITGVGITGSPSGCTVTLAYQQNNATTASAVVSTVSFTPAVSVQAFAVTPTVPSGDNYVAVYACSSTYPTAGTLNISFSPIPANVLTNVVGSNDPCQNPGVLKSSAVIAVASAGEASLVPLATGKAIYVCSILDGSVGTTPSITFQKGTVAGCASGTTAITGVIAFTSGNTIAIGGASTLLTVPAGDVLCALTVGATHEGFLSYVQQ